MTQEPVLQIQQVIMKPALSTSDTLTKLDDVVTDRLKQYAEKHGAPRTEIGYLESQSMQDRMARKRELLQSLEKAILSSPDNKLRLYVHTKKSATSPTTNTVLVSKLIRPMMCRAMLADDIDSPGYRRDSERRNILLVLNTIAEAVLEDKWSTGSELHTRRAQNLLYQGSIGWWLNDALLPAIRIMLKIPAAKKKEMFLRAFEPNEEDQVVGLIKELCAWEIWSTKEPAQMKAMRSNTAKDVADVFPGYDEHRLTKAIVG